MLDNRHEIDLSLPLNSRGWQATSDVQELPVKAVFDVKTGHSHGSFPLPERGINAEYADRLGRVMDTLSDYLGYHSVLCSRALNSPDQFGLVPVALDASHVGPAPTELVKAVTGNTWSRGEPENPVIAMFPAELAGDRIAWAAPGTDLTVFGTFYLIPTGVLTPAVYDEDDEPAEVELDDKSLRWTLAQVGIPAPVGEALWNDRDGVAALADRAVHEDKEAGLVMAALTDTAKVAQGLRQHQWRRAVMDARAAFAGKTLRPRLVPDTVESLAKEKDLELTWTSAYRWGRSNDDEQNRLICGMHELNNYEIFGWNSGVKPLAAVYVGKLGKATDRKFRAYITDLQTKLDARKLGTVVISDANPHAFWITLDVDALNTYRAAFHVPATATLHLAKDWLAGNTANGLTAPVKEDFALTV